MMNYEINKMKNELLDLKYELESKIESQEKENNCLTDYARKIGYAQECEKRVEIAKEQLALLQQAYEFLVHADALNN